jgi:hypothetical protein
VETVGAAESYPDAEEGGSGIIGRWSRLPSMGAFGRLGLVRTGGSGGSSMEPRSSSARIHCPASGRSPRSRPASANRAVTAVAIRSGRSGTKVIAALTTAVGKRAWRHLTGLVDRGHDDRPPPQAAAGDAHETDGHETDGDMARAVAAARGIDTGCGQDV